MNNATESKPRSKNFISISGPYTTGPSNDANSIGDAIMVKTKPYWVVRSWTSNTQIRDSHFFSEEAADDFAETC